MDIKTDTLEITGLDVALRFLDDPDGELDVKGATQAAMNVLAAAIVERAPRETGAMARSIITKVEKVDGEWIGTTGFTGFQGAKALWLEYGHREVTHEPNKREVGMAEPRPFMRPAFDAAYEPAMEAYEEALFKGWRGLDGKVID